MGEPSKRVLYWRSLSRMARSERRQSVMSMAMTSRRDLPSTGMGRIVTRASLLPVPGRVSLMSMALAVPPLCRIWNASCHLPSSRSRPQLPGGPADDLPLVQPQDLATVGIDVDVGQGGGIEQRDAERTGIEDDPEPLLVQAERLLGPLAIGDVEGDDDVPSLRSVEFQGRDAQQHRDAAPVGPQGVVGLQFHPAVRFLVEHPPRLLVGLVAVVAHARALPPGTPSGPAGRCGRTPRSRRCSGAP